jgi:hypothetical protein
MRRFQLSRQQHASPITGVMTALNLQGGGVDGAAGEERLRGIGLQVPTTPHSAARQPRAAAGGATKPFQAVNS